MVRRGASIGALFMVACGSSDPATGAPAPDDLVDGGASQGPSAEADARPSDPGRGSDAGPPPIVVAPGDLEKWVWIPIPEMHCADDSPSGVGVNFTNQSRELVVYFQGNGVCYDGLTCNLFKDLLVGMGPDPIDHMWWGNQERGKHGIFDRTDPDNPFRKSNFVSFPHCTVDGHSADADTEYNGTTVHQHGYRNVTEALKLIVPTFADSPRIVVAGHSAGGIGATMNYHQIATAFKAAGRPTPFLINDSGPVLRAPFLSDGGAKKLWKGWNLEATLKTFCTDCTAENIHQVYNTLAKLYPGLRSSQLNSYSDSVVTQLYMLLNTDINIFDKSKLRKGLHDHETWTTEFQGAVTPSVHRVFFFEGEGHGTFVDRTLKDLPDLNKFLDDQLSGSGAWANVAP